MFSRRQRLLALGIMLLAALLRFSGLRELSLSNDEIAEVEWSSRSWAGMLWAVREDAVHPPLDYMVQHAIGRTGAPEWARRLLPALLGTASVGLLMLLAAAWHSPTAGLGAALLLALSPEHVRISQEVRPYAMGFFFLLLALAALEVFARRGQRRWALLWFGSVFLAGATLYLAGLMAVLASVARLFLDRRHRLAPLWRIFPLALLAWTLLYSPWLAVVVRAARNGPALPAEQLCWEWWQHRLQVLGAGQSDGLTAGAILFWLLVCGGVALSARVPPLRTASVWLLAGASITLMLLHLRPHYSTPRYLLPAWLGAFPLAGACIAAMWQRSIWRIAALSVLAVTCGFQGLGLADLLRSRSDWRGVAHYVHQRAEPGATVVLSNNWVARNFGHYWFRAQRRDDLGVQQFYEGDMELVGPVWIVTGQCRPRTALSSAPLRSRFPSTDAAEVRYLRPGGRISMREPWCPE